ncbi:MAG: hypothetical protein WC027_02985 [Candidatus Paceibacterota bacterium]
MEKIMKKFMLCVLVCASFVAVQASAYTVSNSNDGVVITTKGYWRPIVSEPKIDGDDHVDFGSSRVNVLIDKKDLDLTSKFQVEFMNIQDGSGVNWVRQGWVGHTNLLGGTWRIGRLFVAGGSSTPSRDNEVTAFQGPRVPYNLYAYGVQGEYMIDQCQVVADLSGKSGVAFDSDENDDQMEGSFYTAQDITEWLGFPSVCPMKGGLVGQMSDDEQKAGVWVKGGDKRMQVNEEIYYVESKDSYWGGYLLYDISLVSRLSMHLKYDLKLKDGSDRLLVGGLMWGRPSDRWCLIADYNSYLDQDDKSGVYAAMQGRF